MMNTMMMMMMTTCPADDESDSFALCTSAEGIFGEYSTRSPVMTPDALYRDVPANDCVCRRKKNWGFRSLHARSLHLSIGRDAGEDERDDTQTTPRARAIESALRFLQMTEGRLAEKMNPRVFFARVPSRGGRVTSSREGYAGERIGCVTGRVLTESLEFGRGEAK